MEREELQLNTNIPEILDLGDLCELLRASRPFILKQIAKGRIPAVRFGRGKYLITRQILLSTLNGESRAILESSTASIEMLKESTAFKNTISKDIGVLNNE